MQNIKNCTENKMNSNFKSTILHSDHCDLHVVDPCKEDKQQDETEYGNPETGILRNEDNNRLMLDYDTDVEIKIEVDKHEGGDHSVDTNGLETKSNYRIPVSESSDKQQDVKLQDMIKLEIITFACTQCFEEFPHQQEYDEHHCKPLQDVAGDDVCGTSQVWRHVTAASPGCDSSLATEKLTARQLSVDLLSIADVAHTSAIPVPETLDTNIRVIEINIGSLDNQLLDNNNKINEFPMQNNLVTKTRKDIPCFGPSTKTPCKVKNEAARKKKFTSTHIEACIMKTVNRSHCPNTDTDIQLNQSNSMLIDRNLFTCDICQSTFKRKNAFVDHKKKHGERKLYCCKFCDFKCLYERKLIMHLKSHTDEKPFSCNLCEYKCVLSSDLVKHMRTHTGEKPYWCQLCGYKSAQKSTLVKHMRRHTGEKPYSCKLCEYKSVSNSNLASHMRTHAADKPFACNTCEYQCKRSSELVRHMRIHSGEKPSCCKVCDTKFTRSCHLLSHMRTHTGDKAFACKLCAYECADKRTLENHLRLHTVL